MLETAISELAGSPADADARLKRSAFAPSASLEVAIAGYASSAIGVSRMSSATSE